MVQRIKTGMIADDAVTAAKLSPDADNISVFRNRIINGAMVIAQRGTTASVTDVEVFAADRFFGLGQTADGVFSIAQSSVAPDGFRNSTLCTVTTADSSIGASQLYLFSQKIEGFNIADLMWGTANAQTVTLSFWVRSSLTGTFGGSLRNSEATRSYPFSYVISSANTWEYKTITVAGDTTGGWVTDNGIGIRLAWSLGDGSSRLGTAGAWTSNNNSGVTGQVNLIGTNEATWQITGVQLEKGTQATSFEYRQIQQELALCQRYYYTSGDSANPTNGRGGYNGYPYTNTTEAYGSAKFAVTMRAAPAVTMFDNSGTSGTVTQVGQANGIAATAHSINVQGFYGINKTSGSWASQSSTHPIVGGFTASAEL
jgi:hypothetical protein